MAYSVHHYVISYLLLSQYIFVTSAQTFKSSEVHSNSDVCHTDNDCVHDGMCHSRSRMCICKNRASSYPSCTIRKGYNCKEECTPGLHYCDLVSERCLCRHGGLSERYCCTRPCGEHQVCHQGQCRCAYGETSSGRCRKCMQICRRNERCRRRGGEYICVRINTRPNCFKICGLYSTCRRRLGIVICLSCGQGSQLVNGKCVTPSWSEWGSWGLCSTTCGSGGQQARTRLCSTNLRYLCGGNDSQSRECFNIRECYGTLSEWGEWTQCSQPCNGGRKTRTRRCEGSTKCQGVTEEEDTCNVKLCSWSNWGAWTECSVTCNGGTRSRLRECENGDHCLGGSAEETSACGTQACVGPVDCGWCPPTTTKVQVEGKCKFEEVRTRRPNCPAVQGTGSPCTGGATQRRDVTVLGRTRIRDFLSSNPEGNLFSVTCTNGCIEITKVVHWCSGVPNIIEDLNKVKAVCEGKESCSFKPAPSFFGPKNCQGSLNTWTNYRCNNGILHEAHIDG